MLLCGLVALGACREPPSWAVRWRILPREDMPVEPTSTDDDVLLNGVECSRVGVSQVQLFTTQETELRPSEDGEIPLDDIAIEATFYDVRRKPCWTPALQNPHRTLGGPAVDPGEYQLFARGLRTSGDGWCADAPRHVCNVQYYDQENQGACEIGPAPIVKKCESGVHFLPKSEGEETPCVPGCEDGEVWSFVDGCFSACVPWDDCDFCNDPLWTPGCDEGGGCHPSYLTCDCKTFTAVEDETTQIRDFVLQAPPECQDGIDSDDDGLVDARDPGCLAANQESIDVANTQLVLDFTLLSGNDAASCTGVKVSRFEISLDGQVVSTPPCEIGSVGVNISIAPGQHEVSARALAPDGTPLTRTKSYSLEAFTGGVLQPSLLDVDFADVDFLEPIRSEAQFTVGYVPAEGQSPRFCAGAPGLLEIAEIAVRIVDSAGQPVQPAFLVEAGETGIVGERLDGTPLPCTSQRIITDVRRWGAYRVEVEALSPEGDVCFSNVDAPQLIAPGSIVALAVPRAEPVVASCRDCNDAADCGSTYSCEDGICVP